jgi:hypothetical protein
MPAFGRNSNKEIKLGPRRYAETPAKSTSLPDGMFCEEPIIAREGDSNFVGSQADRLLEQDALVDFLGAAIDSIHPSSRTGSVHEQQQGFALQFSELYGMIGGR